MVLKIINKQVVKAFSKFWTSFSIAFCLVFIICPIGLFAKAIESTNVMPDLSNWLQYPNGGSTYRIGSTLMVKVNYSIFDPGGYAVVIEVYKGTTLVTSSHGGATRSISTTGFTAGTDYSIRAYVYQSNPLVEDWSNYTFTLSTTGPLAGACTPPLVVDGKGCGPTPQSATLSASNSDNICGKTVIHKWYTTETGTTTTPHTVSSTGTCALYSTFKTVSTPTTYWVSAVIDGCETARTKVTAVFSSEIPTVTVTPTLVNSNSKYSGAVYCALGGTASPTLTAAGGTSASAFAWYPSASSGAVLSSGAVFNPTVTIAQTTNGIKDYYVGGTLVNSIGCTFPIQSRLKVSVKLLDYNNDANAGPDKELFSGDAPIPLIPSAQTEWFVNSNLISSSPPQFSPQTHGPGTHIVSSRHVWTYTDTDIQCTTTADNANYHVYAEPAISFVGSSYISKETGVTLAVSGGTYNAFQWLDPDGIAPSTASAFTTTKTGIHRVQVTKGGISKTVSAVVKAIAEDGTNALIEYSPNVAGFSNNHQLAFMSVEEVREAVQYFDDLGRPLQSVQTQVTSDKRDLVTPVMYDEYGREVIQFLPYSSSENDGTIKEFPLTMAQYSGSEHQLFYSNGTSDKVQDDTQPYALTVLERSPLNRVIKKGAVGSAFQPDGNNGYSSTDNTIKFSYEFISANEVLLWSHSTSSTYTFGLVNPTATGSPTTPRYYNAKELRKNRTKDENGNQIIEYVDKAGKMILKRVQVGAGNPSTTDSNRDVNFASTYYIYDKLDRLVCVVPPEATKNLDSRYYHAGATDATKDAFLKQWAFRYAYDSYHRMVQKQLPGAEPIYMVYDIRDRLILTQDGKQRSVHQWKFTKYDQLNRAVITGIMDSAVSLSGMQSAVYGFTSVKPWGKYFEKYAGRSTGNIHGYTNLAFPVVTDPEKCLTVTYYDSYDFKSLWPAGYDYIGNDVAQEQMYSHPSVANHNLTGHITGSKVKVLDVVGNNGASWLRNINYYDDRYRLIQTISENYKGGEDRTSTLYDFAGKVRKTKTEHRKRDVTWRDIVNAQQTGNILKRIISANAGAASVQILPAGKDGWFETTVAELDKNRYIGFNDVSVDESFVNIDYALNMNGSTLQVVENNSVKATYTGLLVTGDILKVERTAGRIRYYRNGIELTGFTSSSVAAPSTTNLIVDTSLQNHHATVVGVRTSFGTTTTVVNRRYEYDHAGRLLEIYHGIGNSNPVAWTALSSNVTTNGTRLIKNSSGTTGGWNAGAFSQQSIPAGEDGWIEFPAFEMSKSRMIGLSDTNPDFNYTSIDYAIFLNGSVINIRENGTSKADLGAYNTNDVFRIERRSSTVYYRKNGRIIYTSLTPSFTTLHVDCSLYALGTTVADVTLGIGSGASELRLVSNKYNELGQLVDKKLHSAAGTAPKQSVDYRYNIRGWLMSMNNASLTSGTNNDETTDYFGFELGYNNDIGISNSGTYNGNISGMKWSNFLGNSTVKEKGYTYSYDPLNRLTQALYKQKTTTWGVAPDNGFSENNYTYDLNGNIRSLTRYDERGAASPMDVLAYDYGTGTSQSNKLLKVSDGGDDFKGFADGTNTVNDYTYDANGNMLTDQNKGITTNIVYNFLNLPQLVVRGGNSIQYIYDATGRKICQITNFNGVQKHTDYAGEFQYQDDVLTLVNHEEGRIVLVRNEKVYFHEAESTSGFTSFNATLSPVTQNGGEKYVKAASTATASRTGISSLGTPVIVSAGDRYRIRVKGYRDNGSAASSNPAYISVKGNGLDIGWPGSALPEGQVAESWTEQVVTVPTGVTLLTIGLQWSTTVAVGEAIYFNELEVIRQTVETPEYQYDMKDHLGNVRLTFTSKDVIETNIATMETVNVSKEGGQFLYYDEAVKVSHEIYDHTYNGTTGATYYATRLTGGNTNEKFGLAKSLSVMPGDVIKTEVYAKYLDPTTSNWTTALQNFVTSIGNSTAPPGTFVDGGSAGSLGGGTFPIAPINHGSETGTAPKAYLNYIVYNNDMTTILESGFFRITTSSREHGQNAVHDRLWKDITIKEPGYVYIYLSNENPTPVEVYFDDFRVEHIKSPIIQMDDYYPFGATFNSYSRENSIPQNFLYQEKEWQQDLSWNLYDFEWRQYDPFTNRTTTMDLHADSYPLLSPYSWAANNPLSIVDPDGRDIVDTHFATTYFGADAQKMFRQLQSQQSSRSSNEDPEKPTFYSFNSKTQARREQMDKDRLQAEKDSEPGIFESMWNATKDFGSDLVTGELFSNAWESVSNYVTDYPNSMMKNLEYQYKLGQGEIPANQVAYDFTYGAWSSVATAGAIKGVGGTVRFLNFGANSGYGVPMNLGRLGKFEFMYRNPSVKGGTVFSYQSVSGGKFRLDFHSFRSRGRTLHFHANYWGYTSSPHRSLNPFRFGQPIK